MGSSTRPTCGSLPAGTLRQCSIVEAGGRSAGARRSSGGWGRFDGWPNDRPRGGPAFAWLAISAFVIAANSFAYDAARYRGGEAAVALGYDAQTVDAGYEWVSYHASGVGNSGSGAYGLTWYDDVLSSSRPCAVLSNSPLDGGALRLIRVDRSAYLQYLFFGPAEPLYLYGALVDGCPPPPAAVATAKAP